MSRKPDSIKPESRWRLWWLLIAIVVAEAVLQVYGPALRGPFLFDDFSLPFYNPLTRVDEISAWVHGVRPLLMFSYWVNYRFSGQQTLWYHLFNVLFHTVNAFLVYRIVRRLLQMAGVIDWRQAMLSGFAGALFLLHPIQTESVAYIAGRSESLSALFFLAAFAIYLYRPAQAIGWGRAVWILLLFGAAVCTKEHTATLPAVLLLTDVFWPWEGTLHTIRRNWRLYGPIALAAVLAVGFIGVMLNGASSAGFRLPGITPQRYFLTQCSVIFEYVRLFLFPAGQNLDYDIPLATARDFRNWIALAGLIALGFLGYRYRRRFPLPAYGFFLFLILLAPTSSIVPIQDLMADRRMYLPILGLILAGIGALLQFRMQSRTTWVGALAAVVVVASLLTYQRNQLWASESAIWEDTLAKSPRKIRGYQHLVHGYVSEHRCLEAVKRLEGFAKNNPIDATLLIHWAFAAECLKQPAQAMQKLDQAARMSRDPAVLLMIAQHEVRLNSLDSALDVLGAALKLNPALEGAYVLRGDVYAQEGQVLMAIQDYEHALLVNPGNDRARHQLLWLRERFGSRQVGRTRTAESLAN